MGESERQREIKIESERKKIRRKEVRKDRERHPPQSYLLLLKPMTEQRQSDKWKLI